MLRLILLLLLLFTAGSACGSGFSFSQYEQAEAAAETRQREQTRQSVQELLSVPCSSRLQNRRVAVLIGEQHRGGQEQGERTNHGPLFDELNRRLRALGLKTLTREQITEQIAAAERTAFLNNDIDAAISAAGRLQAEFLLQGLIRVTAQQNPILGIDEVFLTLTLSLVDAQGRHISSVSATADAFVANDSLQTALQLIREQADPMLAQLYNDYCRRGR